MTDNRILIAEISAAHGIKGLVKLLYFGEDVSDLAYYNPLLTSSDIGQKTITVTIKNPLKGGYIAALEGINDRNAAEALAGTKLYITPEKLSKPDNNEYYYRDLIGCAVYEAGEKIGKVVKIDNFGAGDLLDIQDEHGKSFYLPFKDEFVPKVDISAKHLDVIIPKGWRDE